MKYECIIFTVQWIEKLIVLPSATLRNTLPWYQNILNIHVLDLEILLTWDINKIIENKHRIVFIYKKM